MAGVDPKNRAENVDVSSPEQSFYISATTSGARARKTIKHNDTFVVIDCFGDIGAAAGGPDGLFDSDTRFLSHLEFLINGSPPLLLGSNVDDDNLNLNVDLTNPDLYLEGSLWLPKDSVHISRILYLRDGGLRERMVIQNHTRERIDFVASLAFDSDFGDIFEVRGVRRAKRGRGSRRIVGDGEAVLSYEGLDGVTRETYLCFEPLPTRLEFSIASYDLSLAPREKIAIFVSASCRGPLRQSAVPFLSGYRRSVRDRQALARRAGKIETSNDVVNEVLQRSASDFYMLVTQTEEGCYPYAGIPWYSTTFGRDGVIAAMQMLWLDPQIAKGVLLRLARHQAKTVDPAADAEPGKILHEMRGGEMSALREVPFGLYYGSVDATPLFVILAGLYADRTGDVDLVRGLWPAIEAALGWMDANARKSADGFLTYDRAHDTGLANQGWKDSADSIFHADGRLAVGPIALVEVQGYFYEARKQAAKCARAIGLTAQADDLDSRARALRERFEAKFWCEELGVYALALDGMGARCEVCTSNAGHVLASAIASADRAARVVERMFRFDMYSGWGIRTLSGGERRYNPMSYHNGSVWPHDNAMVAKGMGRYGLRSDVGDLFEAMCRTATYMDQRRLPELFCGFRRRRGRAPILYPVACSPQAWASGAPFMMIEAMLGIDCDARSRTITLRDPALPKFLNELTVRGLRLGDAVVDFTVFRDADKVGVRMMGGAGDIELKIERRSAC